MIVALGAGSARPATPAKSTTLREVQIMAEMTGDADPTGSIYFEGTRGRWVAQVEAGRSASGRRRRRRRYAVDEAGARRALADLLAETAPARLGDPSRWTVGRLVENYILHLDRAPATIDNYRYAAARLGPLQRTPASKLMPFHVESRLRELAAEGASRSYLVRVRSVLGASYRWADRQGLLDVRNPASRAELPHDRDDEQEVVGGTPLRPEEVRALLDVADVERNGTLVWLMAVLGLRPAEARAVALADLDLAAETLHVRRQLVLGVEGLELGRLKTTKSRRDLHLPEALVDRLERQRHERAREQQLMAAEWPARWAVLLHVNQAGRPVDQHGMRRWLRRLVRDAGLERDVTPYALRHAAASMLAYTGAPLETVADLLGHSNTRTTRGVYVHPLAATGGGAQVLRLVRPDDDPGEPR